MNKLVSVIIPIYNIEDYLACCIDSILHQTYQNLQIILVDDGSTDRSSTICEDFASRDSRIVVLHKENGGLSDARNKGMELAMGEYISFIDGDDYVEADYIYEMVSNAEENFADIAIATILSERETHVTKMYPNTFSNGQVIDKIEGLRYLASEGKISTCAWDKLYRREIILRNPFPYKKLYEDKFVMHQIFDSCERIVFAKKAMYHYRIRSGSITSNTVYNDLRLQNIEAAYERLHYYEEHYPLYVPHVKANLCNIAINIYVIATRSHAEASTRKKLLYIINNNLFSFLRESDYTLSHRLRILAVMVAYRTGIIKLIKRRTS